MELPSFLEENEKELKIISYVVGIVSGVAIFLSVTGIWSSSKVWISEFIVHFSGDGSPILAPYLILFSIIYSSLHFLYIASMKTKEWKKGEKE